MKKAILCPGQGAQSLGMGKDLFEDSEACRALYRSASEIMGVDLAQISFEGPEDKLTRSSYAQPAIFVASAAFRARLQEASPGEHFDAAAGLSSGEWTALHYAGVLTFEDTVRVLEARGRFMQEACEETPGGMISIIGLQMDALVKICEATGLQIANLNSVEQTVLSGPSEGIEPAATLASEAGAKRAIPLSVAGAFHSRLMDSAARGLQEFLKGIPFAAPDVPVICNVTARFHGGPEEIRAAMISQVTSPVRWHEGIESLRSMGITCYLECGPGRVLSGLVKRIDKGAGLANIRDLATLEDYLKNGLG